MERLCKYITRFPVAQDRLERPADGKLELSFKRAWRDGTRALVFEPADIINIRRLRSRSRRTRPRGSRNG